MDLTLHPRQYEALNARATEILYGGAAGGGKSHLLRVAAIVYSIQIPGLQTYIFRRTYKELIANHMRTSGGFPELLKEFIDDKLVKINWSDNSIDFQNGSRITLAHCQHDSDMINYQGAQIGFLAVDESTHLSEEVYRFLRSRVRLGALKVPEEYSGMFPRILACSNPGGVAHNFWKQNFVDHGEKPWRTEPADGGMIRQYVPAKLSDNRTLTDNDPHYADRLRGLGTDHLVEAMLNGDWAITAGGAVDDIWDPVEHIFEPFEIPRSWKINRGFDWGSSSPYSVLWFAESDGSDAVLADGTVRSFAPKSVFVIAELYGANSKGEGLRETAGEIARKIKRAEFEMGLQYRTTPGPADNAIFDVQNGQSIAADMERVGVRWFKSDKKPGSRVNGLSRVRQMLKASKQHPQEEAGIFVFSTCRHLITNLPALPRSDKNPEDVDTNAVDHDYDVLRYRVLSADRRLSLAKVVGF